MTGNGRDANGRFAPGNPGGPGRPARSTEREYLDATVETVTPDDWRRIVAKAKDEALDGNAKAREWLGRFLIGKTDLSSVILSVEELDTAIEEDLARLREERLRETAS